MEPQLPDEERRHLLCQIDVCLEVITKRHGITVQQVIDNIKWIEEHRDFVSKLKHASLLTLVGIVVSATALAVWEGIKAFVGRH